MFSKLLIANRGEIACRIIRSARRLGIRTVAVYSEADTNAAHVSMADEAVHIGPSPAGESYLDVDKIIDAMIASGAEAVHPGYGFLSENAVFRERIEKENLIFVGPPLEAINAMGDKITAKKIAQEAGVSTVPGYTGVIKDIAEAEKIADQVGYPVMVKATAGGGGKGMRVVRKKSEMSQAYQSATNEARNSFSDDRIFIEKFIETPRHIEIQVLADAHGNVVCLGERECSIQRHHQKVIEEAPSPFIDEETRQVMYKQCVSLSKKVGYCSAGTVEFIVDKDRNFYFLEMNTRLQVEHPVTEYVTGVDLVEAMLKIADGQPLEMKQSDITLKGWSIESRIYAEDPKRGFLPSSGRITEYQEPEPSEKVRVDSGVYEGGQVSMFYDAMIAKLITYGKDRKSAIKTMQKALGEYVICGISHNISFLEAVMGHQRFASGDITTNFIEEEYPDGFFGADLNLESTKAFLAVAVFAQLEKARRAGTITGQVPGRERRLGNRWVVRIDDQSYPVFVKPIKDGYHVRYENDTIVIQSQWNLGNRLFKGNLNGQDVHVQIEALRAGFMLTHAGTTLKTRVCTPRIAELEQYMPPETSSANSTEIEAPISGKIVDVKVTAGEEVKKGQDLLILEAMKMENLIFAERDGVIKAVHAVAGENTQYGDILIEYEA